MLQIRMIRSPAKSSNRKNFMNSKTPTSSIQRLVELRRNVRAMIACLMALVVVPMVGLALLFFAEGNLRAIGLGFLVYSFALFVVLPCLVLAANEKRGSNARLFASFACFVLAFFTFFYLSYTSTQPQMKFILPVPISILGVVFLSLIHI